MEDDNNGEREGLVLGLELGLGRGAGMKEGRTIWREKRGGRGGGKGKKQNESNNITLCKFMITQMVCLYATYKQRNNMYPICLQLKNMYTDF